MIHLPKWMREIFDKSFCPEPTCRKPLEYKGVYGVGCQEEKTKKRTRLVFCYNYRCPKCNGRTVFTGPPTNWEEFITDIIEISEIPDSASKLPQAEADEAPPPAKSKSKISPSEVSELKNILDESDNLKDFFNKLGITFDQPNDQSE
jgi:hypothetical protein